MRKLHVAILHIWLENLTVTVLICRGFWTDAVLSGRWQMLSLGYICPPFCRISLHGMAVRRATKLLKHLISPLYVQVLCDVTQRQSVSDYRRLEGNNMHWNVGNYFVSQARRSETYSVIVSTCKAVWQQYSDSSWQVCDVSACQRGGTLRRISPIERHSKRYFCFWSVTASGVPRIFFRVGGFNKFSWGQRADRTGIWGR